MNDNTKRRKMPVLFVSHGSPLLALDTEAGEAFKQWGQSLTTPKAVLVFSAHWETQQLAFGETVQHSRLIYDFSGFPQPLYERQYPAPGAPWLTQAVDQLLCPEQPLSRTDRGLDHGVWVPFLHLWPKANIPVLQMSLPVAIDHSRLPGNETIDQALFNLGQRLAPLRHQGVVLIGTGVITHNLRAAFSHTHTKPPLWATSFDSWVKHTLQQDRRRLLDWQDAPYAEQNHPTAEHFQPLLIAAGAADDDDNIQFPVTGFEMNIFSRTSVQFG